MNKRLRIVFMGSPDFAVPTLRAVHEHHEVVAVVTQPDRPKGRGRALAAPPVKIAAEELGLEPVLQPQTLRRRAVREQLAAFGADCFVVVAFGQILRPRLLTVPRLGCVNVHGSLLPRHRGAAPIQWAVLDGDDESGVTILQMDAGVDTGPTLLSRPLTLAADETAGSLHDRLAPLGAEALLQALEGLAEGGLEATPQPREGVTHARMLDKRDGEVDWSWPGQRVDCWIRGMDPWPGAFTTSDNDRLKLFTSAYAPAQRGPTGEVLAIDDRGALVGAGEGAVWVRELQLPGRKRMSAAALASGRALAVGQRLGR
ncbi:MAG: methionyl-tRNA formyltransferase [Proteobacteria bacterium]|nr:MAG: methionyl-tRNA formyltransferase [Pseudomonadota bacterium]